MMLLKLDNVQKVYKDFTLRCSMKVEEGYITGLIGANGAGKSTTFKAILGLIKADGGNVEVFGKRLDDFSAADKEDLGIVLSESSFSFSKEESKSGTAFSSPRKGKISEYPSVIIAGMPH